MALRLKISLSLWFICAVCSDCIRVSPGSALEIVVRITSVLQDRCFSEFFGLKVSGPFLDSSSTISQWPSALTIDD